MLKKIGFGLLCMASSLNTHAYPLDGSIELKSQNTSASATIEYQFKSNESLVLTNYMFWTITAKCRITTDDSSNELKAVALAKNGTINDIPITKGQSMQITVSNGEVLKLSADSGAQVAITNLGESIVRASCSTS